MAYYRGQNRQHVRDEPNPRFQEFYDIGESDPTLFYDYDDETWYKIDDDDSYDVKPKWGSPKIVDEGKYDKNWDRRNFVNEKSHNRFKNDLTPEWDNDDFGNDRGNYPVENKQPVKFKRNPRTFQRF